MKQRVIFAGAGAILLIVLVVVATSFLGRASNAQKTKLTELAQTQTEIIRIASLGQENAAATQTKALATTTKLSFQSSKNSTLQALNKRGIKKVNDKILAAGRNSKNDATLDEGKKNNRYDETFQKLLEAQLANYQKQLRSAFDSGSVAEKKTLQKDATSVSLLLRKPGDKTSTPTNKPTNAANPGDTESEASADDDTTTTEDDEEEL